MDVDASPGGGLSRRALRRFLSNPSAVAGALMCLLVVVLAVFAPQLAPLSPTRQYPGGLTPQGGPLPPGPVFRLGTDDLGRDILSRLIWGARPSLEIGLIGSACSSLLGITLGLLAGFHGGALDELVMRAADVLLAFPFLLLIVLLAAAWRPSPAVLYVAVGLLGWMNVARLMRGQVLAVRRSGYVEAAAALGATRARQMLRHVLPNAVGPVVAYATLLVAYYIGLEAALSFLGLGVPPPAPDWGAMVARGEAYFTYAPWMWISPSLMIALAVLGFNLVGDGLEEAWDPARPR